MQGYDSLMLLTVCNSPRGKNRRNCETELCRRSSANVELALLLLTHSPDQFNGCSCNRVICIRWGGAACFGRILAVNDKSQLITERVLLKIRTNLLPRDDTAKRSITAFLSVCLEINNKKSSYFVFQWPNILMNNWMIDICVLFYYRAMHFSAKRGIAIACRLSVRPSVCLSVCL